MKIRLHFPFKNEFPVTFNFGEVSLDPKIQEMFKIWGIKGHNGLDFGLPEDTEVLACGSGKVIQAGENGDFGICVIIKHRWGESLYAHLKECKVSLGEKVRSKQLIGLSGQTGTAFGPHLHFAIKPKNFDTNNGYSGFINPMPYFKKN